MLKKISLLLLFIFTVSSISFAQTNDTKNNTPDNATKKHTMSAGLLGYVSVPIDMHWKEFYNTGGGIGLTFKYNLFNWLGFRTDLGYNYNSGKTITVNLGSYSFSETQKDYHALEIRELIVIQYDKGLNQAGFNPWAGIGPVISLGSYNGVGIGFAAGVNYNFKNNVYAGIMLDANGYFGGTGNDTFKFALEAGYRF